MIAPHLVEAVAAFRKAAEVNPDDWEAFLRLGNALSNENKLEEAVTAYHKAIENDDPAAAIAEGTRLLKPGGKLLVVDFAPHELEFLREQSAHRRLGFAPEQIKRWLKDAGISVERQRDLAPAASVGPEKLTVSLWLGTKPTATREKKKRTSVEFAA